MPIRINLLAEAQAAEDVRRRDPVKRSIYVASVFIAMVLVWISSLQVKIMADNVRLGNLQGRLNSHTNDYNQIVKNQVVLADVNEKLAGLNRLAANRFLQAPMLDSLMHAPVDGIQITKMHTEQGYDVTAEVQPVKNEAGKVVAAGKPAASVERAKLILDAKDTSANPGSEQINKFKETLAHTPYFESPSGSPRTTSCSRTFPRRMLDNDIRQTLRPLQLGMLVSRTRRVDYEKAFQRKTRLHLIIVAVVTLAVIAGLWFGLITMQQDKIKEIARKSKIVQEEIDKMQSVVTAAGQVQDELAAATNKINSPKSKTTMPSGDLFSWIVGSLKQFNAPSYKVEMPQISAPNVGEVRMFPNYPYSQATVTVSGTAYYYDFGKFLADLENHFPLSRACRISASNPVPAPRRRNMRSSPSAWKS